MKEHEVNEISAEMMTGVGLNSGLLISFEGIDGSGKTTTIRRINHDLKRRGYRVNVFKLPSNECKQLALFTEYKSSPLTAEIEGKVDIFSMFLAVAGDRLNTIRTKIIPLLVKGHAVIVDRYLYSAICEVLISSSGLTSEQWEIISSIVKQFPTPHIAFFNRVSFIEARKRILSREAEKNNFIDPILFGKRIDAFERLRSHFNGTLIDTALDEHSCFKIATYEINKFKARVTSSIV
jgi:dTMP kinase